MSDIRVFVSIPVPDTRPLAPLSEEISRVRNVRASPASQMHITLSFIGDVDESRIDEIAGCVISAAEGVGPFEISVTSVGAFPDRRRPSVVWVGAEPADTLTTLAHRLGSNLDAAGIGRDRKPFRSHITVGRCRGPADLSETFARHEDEKFLTFTCDSVLVMRSVLGPGGAKHSILRRVPL